MPIPEYNEIKAPALKLLADGKPRKISEIFQALAPHFHLTEAEKNEMLPSGNQRRWHNRANWACYDLFRAGLFDRPKKGLYVITDLGRKIAAKNPKHIDRDFLSQFPQFVQFLQATSMPQAPGSAPDAPLPAASGKTQTPEELIASAHRILDATLKKELLDLVKRMDPYQFEHLVVDLLVAMGYGGSREEAGQVTKASGDEGIDGVIKEDRLGLDAIYLQAKRWQQTVGRREIQAFVGALAGQKANKGVFITTSDFAPTAAEYAQGLQQKVILIDGDRLADLMIQHDIGVSTIQTYKIKRTDTDYFDLE